MKPQMWTSMSHMRLRIRMWRHRMTRLQQQLAKLDQALVDPAAATGDLKGLGIGQLGKRHTKVTEELEEAEMAWLEASEALEEVMGG